MSTLILSKFERKRLKYLCRKGSNGKAAYRNECLCGIKSKYREFGDYAQYWECLESAHTKNWIIILEKNGRRFKGTTFSEALKFLNSSRSVEEARDLCAALAAAETLGVTVPLNSAPEIIKALIDTGHSECVSLYMKEVAKCSNYRITMEEVRSTWPEQFAKI